MSAKTCSSATALASAYESVNVLANAEGLLWVLRAVT